MDKIYICDINSNYEKKVEGISYSKFESEVGHLLLKYALKERGIDLNLHNISYNEFGKPYIKTIDYDFNISHDGNLVCLIISDIEVGIDIEFVDYKRDVEKLAKKTFDNQSYNEFSKLNTLEEKVNIFYSYWVRYEAYVKKIGSSINKHYNDNVPDYKVIKLNDSLQNEYYLSTSSPDFQIVFVNLDDILNKCM